MDDDLFLLASGNINISSATNSFHSDHKKPETILKKEPSIKLLIKKHKKSLISLLKSYITKQTTNNENIDTLFYKLFVELENK